MSDSFNILQENKIIDQSIAEEMIKWLVSAMS